MPDFYISNTFRAHYVRANPEKAFGTYREYADGSTFITSHKSLKAAIRALGSLAWGHKAKQGLERALVLQTEGYRAFSYRDAQALL